MKHNSFWGWNIKKKKKKKKEEEEEEEEKKKSSGIWREQGIQYYKSNSHYVKQIKCGWIPHFHSVG